jgi:hypothetical protein
LCSQDLPGRIGFHRAGAIVRPLVCSNEHERTINMGKAIEYNGHPSYNQWNVSLWLGNVESDYRSCIDAIEQAAKVIRATSRKPVTAERVLERATSTMHLPHAAGALSPEAI